MFWQITTFLALAALVVVHLWWLRRWRAGEMAARVREEALTRSDEATRAQAQAQQAAVFDSMVEGVVLLDGEGRILLANRQFAGMFGLAGDLRGQTLMEATRMHELAELIAGLSAALPVQDRDLHPPGLAERWLEVNAAAMFDDKQARRGTVVVFHDLTRIKKLERNREEFVANVSHELRTPLSLIKGYTETLLDGARDNPEVALKFLQTIDRNAQRLKLLIEDLLTISELESGRMRLQLQPLPLPPQVAKLIEDFRPRAGARSIRLVNEVPELSVHADPNRVQQVLSNLMDNAIKYGREEGVVTLSARATEDDRVQICVADNGPGIPEAALARVFERFYRVDKARSREQGGTGLGLSIVKHIVQSHGGKVWAESQVGAGSRFFFTLPSVPRA